MPSRKGGSTQVEATDDHAAASQPERCTDALHILARLLVRTHLTEQAYVPPSKEVPSDEPQVR